MSMAVAMSTLSRPFQMFTCIYMWPWRYVIVAGSLVPRPFGGGREKNGLAHTVCACVKVYRNPGTS